MIDEIYRENLKIALYYAIKAKYAEERQRFDQYGQSAVLATWLDLYRGLADWQDAKAIDTFDVKKRPA